MAIGDPRPYASVKAVANWAATAMETENDVSIIGMRPAVTYDAILREKAPMAIR